MKMHSFPNNCISLSTRGLWRKSGSKIQSQCLEFVFITNNSTIGPAFSLLISPPGALPTQTKVESGTSQSKIGTSVDLSNSGKGDLRNPTCRYAFQSRLLSPSLSLSRSRSAVSLAPSLSLLLSLSLALSLSLPLSSSTRLSQPTTQTVNLPT